MDKRKLSKVILRSDAFQAIAARVLHSVLWFVHKTNRKDPELKVHQDRAYGHSPCIFVFWHGQQLLTSFAAPDGHKLTALVSKSADAEINARILKIAGHGVVRGSGGRVREAAHQKGGISATLALLDVLKSGGDIAVIADISKSAPRKSGKGVVSLAKISGRPIIPLAVATSRFKVIESSWDKTTINLPFGRLSVRAADPIFVPSESTPDELNQFRKKVDDELNRVTIDAYGAVGHSL